MRTVLLGILAAAIFKARGLETTGVASCNAGKCNQACIAAQWAGGYCKDGQCWCWKYGDSERREEKPLSLLNATSSGLGCEKDANCRDYCLFFTPHCISGLCVCWWWKGRSEATIQESPSIQKLSTLNITSCANSTCNANCIAVHWNGGYCKDGNCWCWKYGDSATRDEKPLSELKSSPLRTLLKVDLTTSQSTVGDCDQAMCSLACMLTDHLSGLCMGEGQGEACICIGMAKSSWTLLHNIPSNFRDTAGNDVTSCTIQKSCLDACEKEGATDGFCLNNLCWCSITNGTTNSRRVRPVIEMQSKISEAVTNEVTCNPSTCRRQCNNNSKTGGAACFFGYCWCKEQEQKKIQDNQRREPLFIALRENEVYQTSNSL